MSSPRSRAILAVALSVAAGGVLLSCVSGLGHDIDCIDDIFHQSEECTHDANVRVMGLGAHAGKTLFVRVKSLSSDRDESDTATIAGATASFTFDRFVHEGGSFNYEVRAVVDLDGDGHCDDPPVDAVWRVNFDDDDEDWDLTIHPADMQTCN